MIWGSGGSKSRLAKAAGAEPAGQMRDEKLHAVVARSTFRSQNVQSTPLSDQFWKLRCRKSARRCGAKYISKSKRTKHIIVGPLLEVAMSKKCTPLWREAHFQVKMYTYRHTDTQTHRHTDIQTYRHTDIQTYRHTDIQTYRHTDIHYITLHYVTLRYITLHYITAQHSTAQNRTEQNITYIRTYVRMYVCMYVYMWNMPTYSRHFDLVWSRSSTKPCFIFRCTTSTNAVSWRGISSNRTPCRCWELSSPDAWPVPKASMGLV